MYAFRPDDVVTSRSPPSLAGDGGARAGTTGVRAGDKAVVTLVTAATRGPCGDAEADAEAETAGADSTMRAVLGVVRFGEATVTGAALEATWAGDDGSGEDTGEGVAENAPLRLLPRLNVAGCSFGAAPSSPPLVALDGRLSSPAPAPALPSSRELARRRPLAWCWVPEPRLPLPGTARPSTRATAAAKEAATEEVMDAASPAVGSLTELTNSPDSLRRLPPPVAE